jgi:hypothetical protein
MVLLGTIDEIENSSTISNIWTYFDFHGGRWNPSIFMNLLLEITWLCLVLITLKMGQWDRRLYWLFLLFPVAFGPLLFMGLFFASVWLFGFAP